VLRVAPVVCLLGQELDGAGVRDPQREQVERHRDAAQAQRERALVRPTRRREHKERRAEGGHREADERARNECDERRDTRVPHEARERTAAQQKREETQRREAHGLLGAQIARAQREHREGGKRAASEVRAREHGAASFEQREDREVEDRARAQREPETAQARGIEIRARERRESPEILADLGSAELRLTARAVDELDRSLDRAQARAAPRKQLEQDLEAARGVVERDDVRAPRREEPGHRIAHRRDRPGERSSGARRQLAAQRPASCRAAAHVAAADRDPRGAGEQWPDERWDRRDRVREVGIHDEHDVRARGTRARDHRARETAFAAAHDHAHRMTRRPSARALGGAVARVIVHDDHFEGRDVLQREDLAQQLVDVLRLVERGHHDRERRRYFVLDRFHRGSCGRRCGASPSARWLASSAARRPRSGTISELPLIVS
jgi:hypothetical protein